MQDTNKYKVYKAITAVGKWLLFAIVSFLILFPVLWIFVSSITPPGELFKMPSTIFRITRHWKATNS